MISDDARSLANGRWRALLPMFGVPSDCLKKGDHPCPIAGCGGRDRFAFTDLNGDGRYICRQCGHGDGFDLACKFTGKSFAEVAKQIVEAIGNGFVAKVAAPDKRPVDQRELRQLWATGHAIDGHAATYFRGRGLDGPYSEKLRYTGSMILAGVSAPDGSPATLHRTYLQGDVKVDRKLMAGSYPSGSAIRLWPYDGQLAIAEGIETAMAVRRDFGIPCWSVISAGNMAKFTPPADVVKLHIYGDNDLSFVGQRAAFACASMQALPCEVYIPERAGSDWAD